MTQAEQVKKDDKYISSGHKTIDMIYRNVEWVITALAGTLVFITFIMQVYRIPTGSMAETLRGMHFKLRCQQCGYRYDYDFRTDFYRKPQNFLPKQDLPIMAPMPKCPSCGHYEDSGLPSTVDRKFYTSDGKLAPLRAASRGDQIFVLKCIYQFFEPKRWDVMVFRNPVEPQVNYIKRLVGLPGETVEIVDGDIYIDDLIVRKPPHVQEEEWMCIYDNDYQPIHPQVKQFNGHDWKQPFTSQTGAGWDLNADGPTVFSLDAGTKDAPAVLCYDSTIGNDFVPTYAYNTSLMGESFLQTYFKVPMQIPTMKNCSDLMMQYYVRLEGPGGAGVQLGKYGIRYEGRVDSDGHMVICRLENDATRKTLAEGQCRPQDLSGIQRLRFANVDHLLVLEYGGARIEHDLGRAKADVGMDRLSAPTAAVTGYGKLTLRHLKLMRDIYYRGSDDSHVIRAYEGSPLHLQTDEFFVCGDNSPNSLDARMWNKPAVANPGMQYNEGVVPRDYLVGKAFFVHFPGSWRFGRESLRKIPYLDGAPEPDGIKIIYGGR